MNYVDNPTLRSQSELREMRRAKLLKENDKSHDEASKNIITAEEKINRAEDGRR